jgi:hypothetical protein
MNDKRSKILLIRVAVFVGSYFFKSIALKIRQAAYDKQIQTIRAQQKAKPKPAVPGNAAVATAAKVAGNAAPSPADAFLDIWRGVVAVQGKGKCNVRLEVRPSMHEANTFLGYPTVTCLPAGPIGSQASAADKFIDAINPDAAIFTGTIENDAIKFKTDKFSCKDSRGCAPDSMTVTPFGANALALEWQEQQTCPGVRVILGKARL